MLVKEFGTFYKRFNFLLCTNNWRRSDDNDSEHLAYELLKFTLGYR
jgi:hypothetical protein